MSDLDSTKYNIEYPEHSRLPRTVGKPLQPFTQSILHVYEKMFELPTFIMINQSQNQQDTELFVSETIQPYKTQLSRFLSAITELPITGDEVQILPHSFKKEDQEANGCSYPPSTQLVAFMPLILQQRVVALVGIMYHAQLSTAATFPRAHLQTASNSDQRENADLTKKLKSFRNLARILVPGLTRLLAANDMNDRLHTNETSPRTCTKRPLNPKEILTVRNIDPLTALRTREGFEQRISDAIANLSSPDQRVALFYVDLDHLKVINDAHGHAAGDAALVAVADRLKQMECNTITALRIGGDEYALLLKDTTSQQIRALLEELPSKLSYPFHHDDSEISPKVSIGAATFPDHANSAKELQECADTALYHAKKRGRNCTSLFNQVMRTRLDRQLSLQQTTKQALIENQVGTVFQPIMSSQTNKIKMLEARPEWPAQIHEIARGGDLSKMYDSASFSSILGKTLITAIVHAMRACHNTQLKHWEFLFRVPVPSLLKEGFCDALKSVLRENNIMADKFTLEIPSRTLLQANTHFLIDELNDLTKTGVKLCINHYDSGGLKIEHFQKLNIAYIKLHAGSVEKLFEDSKTARLLTAATEFAHALDIEVILSEIKNKSTEYKLRKLRAEYVQGELYAPAQHFSQIYEAYVPGKSQNTKLKLNSTRLSRQLLSMVN
ncbi:Cyclic di-GMP phosphodiesterase Gmr [Pseudovibrio axinellae]|uniref:Cyclic di-GMP phosphodiesterase Gmr n=1 Tax=Pseudovibrio axinellae TaxID=989403 RepID=A0A166ATI3_9HYPH|nr:diguanylate cyclase [Pseudovibrio axinellae]KZL21531.1 Cyclic di-GMP phosphodiesterase Gmr [Pseudovibrio axinellae]SER08489.1 diguanylate cyclase (GGDEF) domain-containing protein [Pseudovibrio axinellae]